MRVYARRGRPRLRLDVAEAVLLRQLLDELTHTLVADGAPSADDAPVLARLNPAAYRDDPAAEQEFRSMTESTLHGERVERIAACRAETADPDGGVVVDLSDDDVARRWLQTLNDLRLAHGTRLGISEDDDQDLDPTDPAQGPRFVYYWLTALQDTVVRVVMR